MVLTLFRTAALSAALLLTAPFALGQTLTDLIEQYETFNQEGDPDEAARARDEDPTSWAVVTPEYVAQRAEQATEMLEVLNRLNDTWR